VTATRAFPSAFSAALIVYFCFGIGTSRQSSDDTVTVSRFR
jgi:hypothetical protein